MKDAVRRRTSRRHLPVTERFETVTDANGVAHTERVNRSFEAMPRWLKRNVKRALRGLDVPKYSPEQRAGLARGYLSL